MIPREILKKIRQTELRTNRLVSETLAALGFILVGDADQRDYERRARQQSP